MSKQLPAFQSPPTKKARPLLEAGLCSSSLIRIAGNSSAPTEPNALASGEKTKARS